jgi:dipeptidyl aminopeptidase/acylaminoacyl peptidase
LRIAFSAGVKKDATVLEALARSRFLVLLTLSLLAALALGQSSIPPAERQITVADAIRMTRLEGPDYLLPNPTHMVHLSLDGKRFVLLMRKANLEQSTNEFSLLLYETADAFRGPKPDVLLTMSSSSNRDAISQVRWLADNETLIFVGENPGELSQVYSFNIHTRMLRKLTSQPAAISAYDITADGHTLAFTSYPVPTKALDPEDEPSREIVVQGQYLVQILAGDYSLPQGQDIFWQAVGSSPRRVPVDQGYFPSELISLSPDGRYIVFAASLGSRRLQPEWSNYQIDVLKQILSTVAPPNVPSSLRQNLVFDSVTNSSAPLINAPLIGGSTVSWSDDGSSVFLTSYLPLNASDPLERKAREQTQYPVEVNLPAREYHKVTEKNFPAKGLHQPPVEISFVQDVNTPPKILVTPPKSGRKVLLLDPNPQFSELAFGHVETIEYEVSGASVVSGLYLPPDYQPGKRYPLVIQTHGYNPMQFSMDGLSEWSSAFAARPLAARGILVLQAQGFKDYKKDHDRILKDKSLGTTIEEAGKNFNVVGYEKAIELLDKKGMIDRDRVGIIGFSRTVCVVGYTLTHSAFRFAAASLVDGIGCGYFDEIVFPSGAWDDNALNGGAAPFGEGLKTWLKNAPGFNLDKVDSPIRLVAVSGKASVLGALWEWYAGLSLLKKPVDFVLIPGGTHLLVKPRERAMAQQGMIDWFCFWLKGEEDPDPAKAEQYSRWRELRKLQQRKGN